MRSIKVLLMGRQRPASFPRTARASPFLGSPPPLDHGLRDMARGLRISGRSIRLRDSALSGSVNGTQKDKTQRNDSASCLWFGLSVRRSRLGATRRGQGVRRYACPPAPAPGPKSLNTCFPARLTAHARSAARATRKRPAEAQTQRKGAPNQ